MKRKTSELEAENARLKAQNRIIEELQAKLRFTEADSKRYLEQTKEIPGLKAELKKWQEDFRGLDSTNRKMKKVIRQTAIMGQNTTTTHGGAGNASLHSLGRSNTLDDNH